MDAIKKLFKNAKKDATFNKAGQGHRLDQERARPAPQPAPVVQRKDPGQAAKIAGSAALARFEVKTAPKPKVPKLATQVGNEGAAPRRGSGSSQGPGETAQPVASNPEQQQAERPKQPELPTNPYDPSFLRMLERDPIARSVYGIAANNPDDVASVCLATLAKYMENIVSNPAEEKYRKIRVGNKAFQERVCVAENALEFFEAVGFIGIEEDRDGTVEPFLVLPLDVSEAIAEVALATLRSPPKPPIFRDVEVFEPSEHPTVHWDIPATFYTHTADDVKKMNEDLKERAEQELQLRTKAMRIGPNKEKLKMYRLCCIRVRLPDGVILQANFRVREPLLRLVDVIRECMVSPCPEFRLQSHPDRIQLDEDLSISFADLDLIPKALINLLWEAEAGVLLPELLAAKKAL